MVAGGLSVLATEYPAAQRVLDNGKEKLRNFAENIEEEKVSEDDTDGINSNKTELSDFELIEEDGSTTKVISDYTNADVDTENTDTDNKRALLVDLKQKSGSSMNDMKESLRQLTKNRILPLIDRLSKQKIEDDTTRQD